MKHSCSMQRSEQPKTNIISKSEVSIIRWIFLNVMEAFKDEFSDPYVFEQMSGVVKDSMFFNVDSHILSNTCQNHLLCLL